jgi:hypothetical protein
MQSMKKLDNEALHCVCNCSIENVENLREATAHLKQFPPEKFPVHLSASQADGVGGGPPPETACLLYVAVDQTLPEPVFRVSFHKDVIPPVLKTQK